MCMYYIACIHSSTMTLRLCFCILTVVDNATVNTGFPFPHILTHTCYFLIT